MGEAQRNDVTLPAGRVFFTTGVWVDEELDLAERAVAQLQQEVDDLEAEQKAADAEAAGGNVLDRAKNVRAATLRYEQRDLAMLKLRTVAASLPGPSGVVDGPPGLKVGKRGGMSVKRRGPWNRAFGEEYHILGTFSMTPLDDVAGEE